MTDRRLNIHVAFNAINNLSRPVNAARQTAAQLAAQIRSTQNNIQSLERNAKSFDRLTAANKHTIASIVEAKQKAREMAAAYGPLKGRTDEQVVALKSQRAGIRALVRQQKDQQQKLTQLRAAFYQHGAAIDRSRKATEQISARTGRYNQQLAEQQRRLTAISQAQARYNRSKELAGKMASAGMRSAMAGGATLAPIMGSVKAYSSLEDAMKGVTKQVDGLRDDARQKTARFYDMQQAIKAASEDLPMASGAIDYAALVEGGARMGVANSGDPWEKQKADLLTFASVAAMASTAFDLPADQLSESLGKIAGLYKVPIADIALLGDAINYLDDNAQSKGADIIEVLQRMGGFADKLNYQNAASLGSTFLTLGATAEVAASAGNAMVRELSNAMIQPDKFHTALDTLGLSAERIEKSMSENAMGTIIGVLEATSKLAKEKQIPVLTQLFGDQYGDDAAKLANNLPELRRQIELTRSTAAIGSMQRESDINKDSLSAQWMLLKARAINTFSSIGETLREPLISIMKTVGRLIHRFREWVENNKALVGTLLKIGAAIGAILTLAGALMMSLAAIIGPLALLRLSLTTLRGGTGLAGLLSPLKLIGTVGRAAFAPLIGLIAGISAPVWGLIALFAAAAFAVYKFWAPIKAFFSGFFSGVVAGLEPVRAAFAPLAPIIDALATAVGYVAAFSPLALIFDAVATAIGHVWEWLKSLFEPLTFTNEQLTACTSAGQRFGELVGKALSGLFSVITSVARGIGWLLEKLGAIPSAADAALHAANAMAPSDLNKLFIDTFGKNKPDADKDNKPKPKPKPPPMEQPDLRALGPVGKPKKGKASGGGSSGGGDGSGNRLSDTLPARDPNRLGEIVFKNAPAYIPIRGGYAEPTIQKAARFKAPIVAQPPASAAPSAPAPAAVSSGSDTFIINIHLDGGKLDEGAIARRVRAEIEALQAAADRCRRALLTDRG